MVYPGADFAVLISALGYLLVRSLWAMRVGPMYLAAVRRCLLFRYDSGAWNHDQSGEDAVDEMAGPFTSPFAVIFLHPATWSLRRLVGDDAYDEVEPFMEKGR